MKVEIVGSHFHFLYMHSIYLVKDMTATEVLVR